MELAAKEGLALINGTDGMLGMLVLAIADLRMLLKAADIAAAMSVEGLLAHRPGLRRRPAGAAPAPRAGRLRREPAPGCSPARRSSPATAARTATGCRTPTRCAARRRCTARPATPSTTPRWSPRASWPAAIDNPVVLDDGRVESNGNFHGAPVAYVLDFLAIVAADVASISERRTDRFLDVARSHGLPPFLADDPGVDSGHMIAQYTQAAIVSELKRLAGAGQRRLDPVGDAGGPRVDGLVGGPQAARSRRRADPGAGHRGAHRRARRSTCAPRWHRRRPPAPPWRCCASTSRDPGRTGTSRPRSSHFRRRQLRRLGPTPSKK